MYPLPALLTPLPFIRFTTEKITGYTNEAAKGTNKEVHLCVSCFTVSVTPSINTPKSSNDFMILKISFISSFERDKLNPFPALIAPFPHILLPNLFIAFEVKLHTNPGKLSLPKGIARFFNAFFPKLANKEPKLFILFFKKIHVAILHLQCFSYLVLILFLSYFCLQILICLIMYLLV